MSHKFVVHKDCTTEYCMICEGGLGLCSVCGGLEGGLPIECPERQMSIEEQDSIHIGKLEFARGKWWKPKVEEDQ